tara:strand:+ start:316 stop:639 length:324 start_codon:yes stop_codon:yes gene_type:complete
MTPEEAAASLQRAGREAGRLNVSELRRIADLAVDRIEEQWPVSTGRSQDGWTARPSPEGAGVVNPVSYTSDVHDGLADRLVPTTLGELEDDWQEAIERKLTPILEGR